MFGNEHYNIRFHEPAYRVIGSGQEMVTVRCTLTIVDDSGAPVKVVDGFGDKEIAYAKANNRADVGNLTSSTAALAFKDACKYLGIFGYRTTAFKKQDKKPAATATDKAKTAKPTAKKEKKPEEALNFIVTDNFYQQGESKGQPIWKLPVAVMSDGSCGEVVFYHNQTEKIAQRFNELLSFVDTGISEKKGTITLKLTVTPSGDFNGKAQYVFKNFV